MSVNNISGSTPTHTNSCDQGQIICSSLVEVSDGKGRPQPRRLLLTSTHLQIQKNVSKDAEDVDSNRPTHGSVSDRGFSGEGSFDSFTDSNSPPPEFIKREVTLSRVDNTLGISVRGGAEHNLPLIISRLTQGSPAALCKQIYIGDAIISINGVKITLMNHEKAVEFLNNSGNTVQLKLKYFSSAKPFLSPTSQNLCESNLNQWDAADEQNCEWETERQIPLLFALLTRFFGTTDRLRYNAFEVRSGTGYSSGIIFCDAYSLNSWLKAISDTINGINHLQIKVWYQETQVEIFYVGWVFEGLKDPDSENNHLQNLIWKPKVLAIRGNYLYYMNYPPGVGSQEWDEKTSDKDRMVYPIVTTLFRVLNTTTELQDERQHCFSLQIAKENDSFPANGEKQEAINLYLSTETRQELIKVEASWQKAIVASVKSNKKITYSVWWGGRPCQLEIDFTTSVFNMYRTSSKPSAPLWTRKFSALKSSSDDSRTRLTLKFHGTAPPETIECRDLHRVLFTIHSFLLAKVAH